MKKLLYWMVAVLMLFTLSITAFATNEASDGNIKIQVTTDKGSYGATGVAEITATITNVSGEDLNNVTAQAVFDDLAPAGKRTSEISKNTDVLKAGESISFTYKATLNQDEHNLNIFQKIILWFVRLFNSGYNANNNNIDVAIECVTEINFGKFKANNVVQVGYEESSIEVSDEDFRTFQDIRKSIELLSSAEQVVDVLEDEIKKGNIENYQVNENYITFVTESGIRGIWEDETLFDSENKSVSLDGKSNKVKKTPSGNSYKDIIKQVSSSSVISSLGDVAVIRPYRSTDFKYDDFVTTGEIIADAIGVDIDIFDNANASLSVLKDLDEYGVVLVDSHGTLINDEPYICLTQTYNNQEVSSSDLDYIWINQNNLIRVHSSFFENNYIDNQFDECLVFLGTCYSMYDDSFSNTLIEKGVDCVYGYTDTVSVSYCNDTLVESMLENILLDGDTSNLAFSETVSVCGGTDPHNSDTDFVIQQSSDFCLSKTGYSVGLVKDKDTDERLSNITITAKSDRYTSSIKTETDGTFKLKLPVGKYIISATGSGYRAEQEFIVTVEKDSAETLPNPIYMIKLNTGTLTSTVLEETTEKPMKDVTVSFTSDNDYLTTTTDENGKFNMRLPLGEYKITVCDTDTHYCHESRTVTVIENEEIILSPAFYMKQGTKVTGKVVDKETNTPLSDITLEVFDITDLFIVQKSDGDGLYYYDDLKERAELVTTVTTDENGEYFFNAPVGDYVITVNHENYKYYDTAFSLEFGLDEYFVNDIRLVDKTFTGFAGGNGTKENPYQVATPKQLNAVRNDLTAHYIQVADIDMSEWGNWEPIGSQNYSNSKAFSGSFNGNGYAVSNLKFNYKTESDYDKVYYGMFGYTHNAEFSDLNVSGSSINIDCGNSFRGVDLYIGDIVAYAHNTSFKNCSTVDSTFNISIKSGASYGYVGGIVGCLYLDNFGIIDNCTSDSTFILELNCSGWDSSYDSEILAGGICGKSNVYSGGTLSNCINYSTIYSENQNNGTIRYSGITYSFSDSDDNTQIINCTNYADFSINADYGELELCGITKYADNMRNCNNYGDFSVTKFGKIGISGVGSGNVKNCNNYGNIYVDAIGENKSLGGVTVEIGGISHVGGSFSNCNNYGSISAKLRPNNYPSDQIGGIVGRGGIIDSCKNIGDITVSVQCSYLWSWSYAAHVNIGGIVGETNYRVIGCINEGNISVNNPYVEDSCSSDVGGIVGNADSVNELLIDDCYNTGNIHSISCAGGIIGDAEFCDMNITNCYNAGNIIAGYTDYDYNYYSYAGGIVGIAESVKTMNCKNLGVISSLSNYGNWCGEIYGYSSDSYIVE